MLGFRYKILVNLKIMFLAIILTGMFQFLVIETICSAQQPDFTILVGEWVRPDGGYVISVRDISPDGSVDGAYFNPKEINIAEANVSEWKGMGKLFIKLHDEGYPGSIYTLYYYAEKDALVGFYYQAVQDQAFEVVFLRKNIENLKSKELE